jgi:hypothetical protein
MKLVERRRFRGTLCKAASHSKNNTNMCIYTYHKDSKEEEYSQLHLDFFLLDNGRGYRCKIPDGFQWQSVVVPTKSLFYTKPNLCVHVIGR